MGVYPRPAGEAKEDLLLKKKRDAGREGKKREWKARRGEREEGRGGEKRGREGRGGD